MGLLQIVFDVMLITNNIYRSSYNQKSFANVSSSVVVKDLQLYGCECFGIAKA
jgi:hypothetical protein